MFVHTVIMVIEPHMKQGRQHKLISTIFLATSVTKKLDHNNQTQHEVTFAYADDSTPVVEVTFNLTNEKPEVPETPNTPDTPQSHEEIKVSNAPKTGDSTNIWLPILLLVISTGGMAGLYFSRKRKSK